MIGLVFQAIIFMLSGIFVYEVTKNLGIALKTIESKENANTTKTENSKEKQRKSSET